MESSRFRKVPVTGTKAWANRLRRAWLTQRAHHPRGQIQLQRQRINPNSNFKLKSTPIVKKTKDNKLPPQPPNKATSFSLKRSRTHPNSMTIMLCVTTKLMKCMECKNKAELRRKKTHLDCQENSKSRLRRCWHLMSNECTKVISLLTQFSKEPYHQPKVTRHLETIQAVLPLQTHSCKTTRRQGLL